MTSERSVLIRKRIHLLTTKGGELNGAERLWLEVMQQELMKYEGDHNV